MNVINMKNEDLEETTKQERIKTNLTFAIFISVVQFRRGSRSMFYKNNMTEYDLTEFKFFKVNFHLDIPKN